MNSQKVILIIVGIAVVIGLGLLALKSSPKNLKTTDNIVIEEGNLENDMIDDTTSSVGPLIEFGKPLQFSINEETTFSDGFTIRLKEINDSRCKPDVQCIWAGEISTVFEVSFDDQRTWKEINLGTTNNKSVTLDGYTFALQDATETSVTIIVSKN